MAQSDSATEERTEGPTPNGGAYAVAYFKDDSGRPAARESASRVCIVEYSAEGQVLFSTFGLLGGDAPKREARIELIKWIAPWKRVLAGASLLVAADAFLLNQGVLAALVLLLVCPILVVRAGLSFRNPALRKRRLVQASIFALASALVLAANRMNNSLAETRADALVAVLEKYKSAHGVYPARLEELVPEWLPEIPAAKYTLLANRFTYFSREGRHDLMYVVVPPFGRRFYSLEEKRWGVLD